MLSRSVCCNCEVLLGGCWLKQVKQQVGKVRALARALCSCHTVTQKCASSAQNAMLPTCKSFRKTGIDICYAWTLVGSWSHKFTKHGNSCALEKPVKPLSSGWLMEDPCGDGHHWSLWPESSTYSICKGGWHEVRVAYYGNYAGTFFYCLDTAFSLQSYHWFGQSGWLAQKIIWSTTYWKGGKANLQFYCTSIIVCFRKMVQMHESGTYYFLEFGMVWISCFIEAHWSGLVESDQTHSKVASKKLSWQWIKNRSEHETHRTGSDRNSPGPAIALGQGWCQWTTVPEDCLINDTSNTHSNTISSRPRSWRKNIWNHFMYMFC